MDSGRTYSFPVSALLIAAVLAGLGAGIMAGRRSILPAAGRPPGENKGAEPEAQS